MTINLKVIASVTGLLLAASAPAFANSQLIASAGLTQAEAAGLSLSEIAQAKFNNDTRRQDRQPVMIAPGSGGDVSQLTAAADLPASAQGWSLNEVFVAKINASADREDRQGPARAYGVTAMSRSVADHGARAQLIANAGLTPAEAAGLSLNEIFVAKINTSADREDRQGQVYN